MKTFSFVLILVFLIGCKEEKTFADDIILNFPKDTKVIKKYFAFPVFIKNISDKILRIPTESKRTALYIYEDNLDRFYFARNSNYMICGITGGIYSYIELKPNEILVYAYPYFKSGTKQKAKMKFYNASSKEFEISIDDTTIKSQRDKRYE